MVSFLTKVELAKRLKDVKETNIKSRHKAKNPLSIYIIFPIYTFFILALPVLVFTLVGIVFSRK